MSGWTSLEHRSVKLAHHSTSSLVEITITAEEEVEQGRFGKVVETIWVDYATFSDLRKAINQTDFP